MVLESVLCPSCSSDDGMRHGQGEDASLIHAANPATLMAVLRSWAISLFRTAGIASLTKATRTKAIREREVRTHTELWTYPN